MFWIFAESSVDKKGNFLSLLSSAWAHFLQESDLFPLVNNCGFFIFQHLWIQILVQSSHP